MDCGLRYSTPLLSYRVRLFANDTQEEGSLLKGFRFATLPFTPGVWAAFFSACVLAALLMGIVEGKDRGSLHKAYGREIELSDGATTHKHSWLGCRALWISLASFLGASNFEPERPLGRVIEIAWMIVVVVIVSFYTANLAAIRALQARSSDGQITSIDDIDANNKLCIRAYGCWPNPLYPDSKTHTLCELLHDEKPQLFEAIGTAQSPIKFVEPDPTLVRDGAHYGTKHNEGGPSAMDTVAEYIRRGDCAAGVGYDMEGAEARRDRRLSLEASRAPLEAGCEGKRCGLPAHSGR